VASNKINDLAAGTQWNSSICHRIATERVAGLFSVRTPDLGERRLHNLGGAGVGVRE
jgi:hypothetical protein